MRMITLAPDVAANYGVPCHLEEWRFELIAALRDPEAYSDVLATVATADLYATFARLNWIGQGAGQCIEYFVPAAMSGKFFASLAELKSRVTSEAVVRGITLLPEQGAMPN